MLVIGPFIVALCRLARKPVVLRIFGGGFGDYYFAQGRLQRAVIRRLILSADVVLLQTRRSIAQLQEHASGKLVWFSTYVRQQVPAARDERSPRRKTGAARASCFSATCGGPRESKRCSRPRRSFRRAAASTFTGRPRNTRPMRSMRAAAAGSVIGAFSRTTKSMRGSGTTIASSCRPSIRARVIRESLPRPTHHGLPVITTRWLAIPEIVDESCGLLIEPRDTPAFIRAITEIHGDPVLWRRLKAGARAKAGLFDHAHWSRQFEEICRGLRKLAA